jgi:putative addiction module component (TIGR02574 family)
MSLALDRETLDNLTTEGRLELIGILWDAITDSDPNPPIPDWHMEELARRRGAAEADPDAGIPWEEVRANLISES